MGCANPGVPIVRAADSHNFVLSRWERQDAVFEPDPLGSYLLVILVLVPASDLRSPAKNATRFDVPRNRSPLHAGHPAGPSNGPGVRGRRCPGSFIVPVVRIAHLCRNRRQGKSVFIECWLFWPGVMDRDWSLFGPEIVARGFVGRLKTQAVRLDRAVHSIARKKSESALHRLRHDGRPRQALFPQATTWYVSVQCQGEVEVCEFHGSPAGERSMSKDGEGKPVIGSALTVSVAVM